MKVVESIFIWGTIIFTAVMLFIGIREMISKARDVGLRQTIQYAIRIALFLAVLPLLLKVIFMSIEEVITFVSNPFDYYKNVGYFFRTIGVEA